MAKRLRLEAEWLVTYRAARLGPLGPQLQLDGQLADELSEEVGVAVLAHLPENKPVPHLALGQHVLQTLGHVFVILVPDLLKRSVVDFKNSNLLT